MTLKEHIDDIAKSLEQDMFPNETEVCDKIVHRILDILNWPRYDHGIRLREYDLRGLRVDFALCHPASEPQVFIEVKRIGNIDGAEDQLFGYASRENVPLAVLTDGRKWQFFYPSGLGDYDKRKVDELDLKEGNSEENAELFNRYLGYKAIRTGEAAGAIQGKYEDLSKQRQIEKHLPNAWKNLVESGDESLINLVAEATQELCGHRPDDEQVLAYLKREELPLVQPNRPESGKDQSKHIGSSAEVSQEYTWKNKPLTPNIAQLLIVELFSGKGETRKKAIVDDVKRIHLDRGGLSANTEHVDQLFAGALKNLKNKKSAKSVRRGYWEIYQPS